MSSTADAVEVSMSAGVESLAVVWEVRESMYISSSPVSPSPDRASGRWSSYQGAHQVSRGIFYEEASFCCVGLGLGLVVLLGLSQEL